MNIPWCLAKIVIKELYRRKDFYVLFVLTALISLVMGSVSFFDDDKIVRYLKEICLLLIWISSIVIAITTAARQIPAEWEHRTIFPLLAKPVTRGQVIVGKFLGCWLACGLTLLVFYIFFGTLSAVREHELHLLQLLQAIFLHWVMLGVLIAMCLLGSIVFAAPSSNGTICFVVTVGIMFLGRHLNTLALGLSEPARTLVYGIYFTIPHLEMLDVRDLVIHEADLIPWGVVFLAGMYAAIYTALFLIATWTLFRRKALN